MTIDLTRYIFSYYSNLMTLDESAAYKSLIYEEKAAHCEPLRLRTLVEKRWVSQEPDVRALLADGPDVFMQKTTERILREHGSEVFLNYCPRCGALAKTPRAKQCPMCFFSWHENENKRINE